MKSTSSAVVLDVEKDSRVELRGSKVEGTERTIQMLIDRESTGAEQFVGGYATFEPGMSVALHAHEDAEEINVVVSGEGLFITEEETTELKQGDWQFIPKGVRHSHANTGDTPFTILWLYSPQSESVPK